MVGPYPPPYLSPLSMQCGAHIATTLGRAPQGGYKVGPTLYKIRERREAGRGAAKGGLSTDVYEFQGFKTPLKEGLPDSYPLGEDLHIKGLLF